MVALQYGLGGFGLGGFLLKKNTVYFSSISEN